MIESETKAREILMKLGLLNIRKQQNKKGVPDFIADWEGSSCAIEVKSVKDEIRETDSRPTATLKRDQMHKLAKNIDSGGRSFVLYFDKSGQYFLFELIKANRK